MRPRYRRAWLGSACSAHHRGRLTPERHEVEALRRERRAARLRQRRGRGRHFVHDRPRARAYEIGPRFRRARQDGRRRRLSPDLRAPTRRWPHFDAVVAGEAEDLAQAARRHRGRPAQRDLRSPATATWPAIPMPRRELTARNAPPLRHRRRRPDGPRLPSRVPVLLDHGLPPRHAPHPSARGRARGTTTHPTRFHVRRRQHHRRPRLCQAAVPRDGPDEEALDQPVLAEDRRRPRAARLWPRPPDAAGCSSASKRSAGNLDAVDKGFNDADRLPPADRGDPPRQGSASGGHHRRPGRRRP